MLTCNYLEWKTQVMIFTCDLRTNSNILTNDMKKSEYNFKASKTGIATETF